MELLIAGNLANHGYNLAKLLRERRVSADLLIKKNPKETEDPRSADTKLNDYPDWIRFWDGNKPTWKFQVIRIMREYEVIHASTELPIFAQFSGRPFVAYTTGADIVKLAQENSLKGWLLRRAYRKAAVVIFPTPYLDKYVKKLEMKNAIFIPILPDYTKFTPDPTVLKDSVRFTIFHPTNHLWSYKKNDRFLRAFVKLAKERNDIHLIMINRGPDFDRSMEILNTPSTKGKFTVIDKTLEQNELLKFYNQADVVVDQFGVGSTGLIGQEVMACEKPLIQYIDKTLYETFYSEAPPIVNASNEEEIYVALSKLINDRELCKKIGKESREWLLKHHNHDKIIRKYIHVYTVVKDRMNFQKIKDTLLSIG